MAAAPGAYSNRYRALEHERRTRAKQTALVAAKGGTPGRCVGVRDSITLDRHPSIFHGLVPPAWAAWQFAYVVVSVYNHTVSTFALFFFN